ncbi:hypothetical protein A2841_03990 [Candidatus Kaiserbacteria bacterium RIFCSPHIGHO2_01_FULL_48_10]|uniref:Triosephosphate isomerase n=1 Tax=Candidatus Kaiserbacteria bacterium RIFCSPHIGHO2_01_FULL_48_10 TaxID=1798476 RepID=A0A1F6C525_9BACT|nr:MAG: hypothetical protein A2841_03990 [Candidatus Kaiserbacteria bacterium RIFCSPHIGHO2_01_FULL_48_10]
MAKPLIVGNWKMYVNTFSEGKKLLKEIDHAFPRGIKADVVVCPPVALAIGLRREYAGRRIVFGTQDSFWEQEGAFTGGVSPRALFDSGIEYVIIGHAEQRMRGDTNDIVAKKVSAALLAGLRPVVCVGENARDEEGKHFGALKTEIVESLARVAPSSAGKVIIAYDPLWAIGQDTPAPPRLAAQSIIFIRKTLAEMWGREQALKTRIIYGGSVDSAHASLFAEEKSIQGLLPGRASVDAREFCAIIKAFSYS